MAAVLVDHLPLDDIRVAVMEHLADPVHGRSMCPADIIARIGAGARGSSGLVTKGTSAPRPTEEPDV